jgi:hypothetical protein
LGLGEEARGGVGEGEEGCAGGGGEGEEFALVVAGDEASDVGAMRPTKPIGPLMATTEAVMSEARMRAIQRRRWMRRPRDWASGSLRSATLSWG